jgi:hypothetical protein
LDNKLIRQPNLIIAGTVKGGTTSLFSYLSTHPDVCASKVKETCYFLPYRYGGEVRPWGEYIRLFSHCQKEKFVLEATPGYFDGGTVLAGALKETLGNDVHIIITLRNPTDRFISFFYYHRAQLNLPADISAASYLALCREMPPELRCQEKNDAFWGVDGGRYVEYLPAWFEAFGEQRTRVVFFEDLAADPRKTMLVLAQWLDIDPAPFARPSYDIENRTVPYRLRAIHKTAISINKRLEPILRRFPKAKKTARLLYYAINSAGGQPPVSNDLRESLDRIYVDDNERLSRFLKSKGYDALPSWLRVEK